MLSSKEERTAMELCYGQLRFFLLLPFHLIFLKLVQSTTYIYIIANMCSKKEFTKKSLLDKD